MYNATEKRLGKVKQTGESQNTCRFLKSSAQELAVRENGKMMRLKLAIGLWLLAVGASAQTDIWRSDSLQEVVVTGTGTQHLLKNAPVQTEVITHRMLKDYG